MIKRLYQEAGRHGHVIVAPGSCDALPDGFWGVPTDDQLAEQERIRNLDPAGVTSLLKVLGEEGLKLAQLLA